MAVGSSPTRGGGESMVKEPALLHPANVSCSFEDGSCSAAMEPSCPSHSQRLRHPTVDTDVHAGASMPSSPLHPAPVEPPPPPTMARNRISLVQTPSGKHVWWMDHGISSRRTEAMMRRRMKYLEEEAARNASATERGGSGEEGIAEDCQGEQVGGSKQTLAASEPAFADTPADLASAEPSDNNKQFSPRPASSTNYELPEVSLEEDRSAVASLGTKSAAEVSCAEQSRPNFSENNIPVVHLSSTNKQRAFLDFGEENAVGEAATQSFLVQAPSDPTGSDFYVQLSSCGEEFQIQVDQCAPDRGMRRSEMGASSDVGPIQFALGGGESKLISVIWTPSEVECVRGAIRVDVHNCDGSHWKQSVVIVGKSHAADQAENDQEDSDGLEYLIDGSGNFTRSNMISEITDSMEMEYSQEELDLGINEEEQLLAGAAHYVGEKKCEEDLTDDSGMQPKEQGAGVEVEEQHSATEDIHEKNLWSEALASLELSDIEVNDSDSQKEVHHEGMDHLCSGAALGVPLRQSDTVVGDSASSFEEIVGVALPLPPIDEASSISSELGDEQGLEAHNGNSMEEPQDIGYELPSEMEESECDDAPPTDEQDQSNIHLCPRVNAQKTEVEELVATPCAEKPLEDFDENLRLEEKENAHVPAEERKSKVGATELEEMLALEGLVALAETGADQEMSSNASHSSEGSSDDDSLNASKTKPITALRSPLVRLDQQQLRAPPLTECLVRLQSLTSESIEQGSSPESADSVDPLVTNHLPLLPGDQSPGPQSFSDCLASVQDLLINSSDRQSTPSPTEDLLLSYPSPERERFDESEESLLVSLMDQASVDSSPEKSYVEEVKRTKNELTELLEGVSELEEIAQRQHTYITSPTNHDFHTQLDNINKGIDAITPPSAKLKGASSKSGVNIISVVDTVKDLSEKKGRPRLPTASLQHDTLLVPTPKKAARQCYFFQQSKDGSSSHHKSLRLSARKDMKAPAAEESAEKRRPADTRRSDVLARPTHCESAFVASAQKPEALPENRFKTPHCNMSKKRERKSDETMKKGLVDVQSSNAQPKPSNSDPTHLRPSLQNSVALPDDTFKTPHRSRSEKLIAIRNKLRGLTDIASDPKASGNLEGSGSELKSTERSKMISSNTKKSPTEMTVMIDQLPNALVSSAQRCYFYHKSPRRNASAGSASKATPQSPIHAPGCSEEKAIQQSGVKERLIFSPPALGPREKKALEQHINTIRKRRSRNSPLGDSPDGPAGREISGSSPRVSTPSPREIKAYEKHIRSMRKRLSKGSPPESSPSSVRKSKADSAYGRHIGRMKGHKSPEDATK